MSAAVGTAAPTDVGATDRTGATDATAAAPPAAAPPGTAPPGTTRRPPSYASVVWPTLVALVNATAFFIVRPNVSDLQAALARQSAASDGVGLGYWFQWFGGGSTPGNYSVISPYLSALIGAVAVGALASVAITPLVARAAAGLTHPVAATWVATVLAALNIWSGRVPFALGCAIGIVGIIGVRERRRWVAIAGIVGSSLCSPVSGAFLVFVLGAVFLVDRGYRRFIAPVGAACGLTLVAIALFFGAPGPQGYPVNSVFFASTAALAMLLARPARALRVALWWTAVAAPILMVIPNGMGSNWSRLPWLCLPIAVAATATRGRALVALALVPAIANSVYATGKDIVHAHLPSASASYYSSLITQLDGVPDLRNFRLEVVQDPLVHTAAYALLGHAALAGGWETQEQHELNSLLEDGARLNATSYKVWLDNNAVGYVAVNKIDDTQKPEYQLVTQTRLPYLVPVSSSPTWALYRVQNRTPIVPAPQRLLSAGQAQLKIRVPCACEFALRVRYSKFLTMVPARRTPPARVQDDGSGWTVVTTPAPGDYTLSGSVIHPLG